MLNITVDCTGLSVPEIHGLLAEALHFPSWYGNNLDALYDCLTDLDGQVHLSILGLEHEGIHQTLLDAAADAGNLTVAIL